MQYRQLGRSGLYVSALCLGTMTFGDRTNSAEARRIVQLRRVREDRRQGDQGPSAAVDPRD
jgi:aryl-alcohol dehydrogenase-like predicted oxidoreductase